MKSAIIIVVLAVLVGLTACRSEKTVPPTVETEHHGEHENENTAILTDEQMKSVNVQLGSIEKKQLTASLRANGILEVPNQNKASATASMGGVIQSIQVQTGSNVRTGQVIATITNSSFITLQEDYLSVTSKSELAELEYARQKELQQGNATALKNLQSADAELRTLKAKRASLRKQLELIGISAEALTTENIHSTVSIRSPISGVIRDVKVNIGSYVDANSPIAEIVDNSQLHLDLFVYEKDLPKVRVGQTIHFTLTNNPGQEYDADIYAISNTFDPTSKAVAVHAIVKGNKQGLIDKMSITALVSLENATVDAVPTDAIVNHEGQDYIFIVADAHAEEEHHSESETTEHKLDEQGQSRGEREEPRHQARDESKHEEKGTTFERIPIRKGTTDVGYSEITLLKEIPANSRVAVKGAFFILAKMNNKGEGHAH
ncbi:MAG: efflux RND transporter periplasmic adaptor subunit [Ignavibacteria bacterium]|nr:efflux RND transporter periplasmic adaptor subunit [Ignavibacteria bacterium]